MATCSSILAWKIPWTEKPGGLESMGHKESEMTELTHTVTIRTPSSVLSKLDLSVLLLVLFLPFLCSLLLTELLPLSQLLESPVTASKNSA